jgi:UDP-N-acetylglucosamine--N-acetylmuramyl-(pentapeptide) pyrophosphoryl-undecaprenol N-acetylglucosamine transferase
MTVLLVAATGGHLAQLDRLSSRIPGYDQDSLWVTFDTPQSRAMLRQRRHVFVRHTAPRDLSNVLRNLWVAARIMRAERPTLVVSTGNAIAVAFLPLARATGASAAYIESAARSDGPSLTGKLLKRVPGVQLFTQYQHWAAAPWGYAGSVFDEYVPLEDRATHNVRRVFVTLGTIGFGFRRLVDRVLTVVPRECEVIWQLGVTNASSVSGATFEILPAARIAAEMARADVVIAHAGIGSALAALDEGKCPILVPRRKQFGEHVDDHQSQIAAELANRGLALHRSVDMLGAEDLQLASGKGVGKRAQSDAIAIACGRRTR